VLVGFAAFIAAIFLYRGGLERAGVLLAIFIGLPLVLAGLEGLRRIASPRLAEPDRIERLESERQNELIRGTSMHLRDMGYRYSIRFDRTGREAFTKDVNTIRLGFIPVVIADNLSERQGHGFAAFPFDGERWRGPGLPCGGTPEEAAAHAAKCVMPIQENNERPAEGA
jgi:hypothetical protein